MVQKQEKKNCEKVAKEIELNEKKKGKRGIILHLCYLPLDACMKDQ